MNQILHKDIKTAEAMRPMALKTSLKIQLRYDPFMSMSCHLSEVVTAPSQNGVEGIFYLVLESRLIGLTV
jgi:hypothetical protein